MEEIIVKRGIMEEMIVKRERSGLVNMINELKDDVLVQTIN